MSSSDATNTVLTILICKIALNEDPDRFVMKTLRDGVCEHDHNSDRKCVSTSPPLDENSLAVDSSSEHQIMKKMKMSADTEGVVRIPSVEEESTAALTNSANKLVKHTVNHAESEKSKGK
jgi:hypothetical protein